MLFSPPDHMSILWPHCVAEDIFIFREVPKVIDRAFRVYNNICETRGKLLFYDVSPPRHLFYKHPELAKKRIAIEYNLDNPNRMKPLKFER